MTTTPDPCGCVLTRNKRTGEEFWSSLCPEHAAVHARWAEEHKLTPPLPPTSRVGKGKTK